MELPLSKLTLLQEQRKFNLNLVDRMQDFSFPRKQMWQKLCLHQQVTQTVDAELLHLHCTKSGNLKARFNVIVQTSSTHGWLHVV